MYFLFFKFKTEFIFSLSCWFRGGSWGSKTSEVRIAAWPLIARLLSISVHRGTDGFASSVMLEISYFHWVLPRIPIIQPMLWLADSCLFYSVFSVVLLITPNGIYVAGLKQQLIRCPKLGSFYNLIQNQIKPMGVFQLTPIGHLKCNVSICRLHYFRFVGNCFVCRQFRARSSIHWLQQTVLQACILFLQNALFGQYVVSKANFFFILNLNMMKGVHKW